MQALEINNLVKEYPSVRAVDRLSFSVAPGICFGLLGPNGAGKTTTLEIAEGIIKPTSGEIFYKGSPRSHGFSQEVGIQFQSTSLLSFLTVRETLQTFRRLYKKPMDLERLASICQLHDIMDRRNDKVSGGQKQRLLLAMALVNDPELVFLDEPTTGLDPQARRHVWDIVRNLKSRGKTLVLTTHYMEEAQKLCDEIAIMDSGGIIAEGTPESLLKEYGGGVIVSIPARCFPVDPRSISGNGIKASTKGEIVRLQAQDVNLCLQKLLQAGVDMTEITVRSPNLEDLFLHLTGRSLRE